MKRIEEIIAEAKKHEYDWGIDVDRFDVPDIFAKGAEWADKTIIEKACKWLINIDFDDFHFRDCDESFNNDLFVDAFRKAMEE